MRFHCKSYSVKNVWWIYKRRTRFVPHCWIEKGLSLKGDGCMTGKESVCFFRTRRWTTVQQTLFQFSVAFSTTLHRRCLLCTLRVKINSARRELYSWIYFSDEQIDKPKQRWSVILFISITLICFGDTRVVVFYAVTFTQQNKNEPTIYRLLDRLSHGNMKIFNNM